MMFAILEALLIEVLIPEIAAIIRWDPSLTDAEVIAEFKTRRERIMANGRAFLEEIRGQG